VTFEEVLTQTIAMLQRLGRVSYRALKRQFALDDAFLEDLKYEITEVRQLAVDHEGSVLVWTGDASTAPASIPALAMSAVAPLPTTRQAREPLVYTPPYLAEKILTSRGALAGERKQVTVLFADLKGSMELLADRDPEEARQLLDPVLERMMAAVHRYEGTVNQIMGDGIMALFGAPIAHEDHAIRACYAALAMQEAIRRYSDEVRRVHGIEVQIRVGLNSGEVVVRAIGNDLHMDYSAIGQTTHLAARMEQLAPPGSIRLTADTLRLAEGWVQVTPLGPVPVKGLPAPVEVCELMGAGPARTRLQAFAARGLTPFVGRQAELAALHQALEQSEAGHGQVVAVIGEPGVGKTRLFHEFTHASRTQGWLLLESSSTSYGKATPYLPVIDLLKAYFQLEDRDDGRRMREKLTGRLLTLDPTLGPTLPAFLALLEVPVEDAPWQALDPAQRRQRTLDALNRLLLRESQGQPLLVVFENLHWIDTETQTFLDGLVESLPATRLLLLVNYRPEYQHGWSTKTYYTQLRLDPLPSASAEALLQNLLGDDSELGPLTQRLIERTQGNPFFLEESVRTLVEMQGLVGTPGAYRLAQALPSIQVPATVQAVLAARIDRLPPEEKQLLQTAAVIGTEVPLALLQAVAEVPEEPLRLGFTHLQAAEFLYETRLFPDIEYTFKHALTQQVAYETLLQERRRALHARIVEDLEALAGEQVAEQVERLAHHALRGEVWDKAVSCCQQAGVRAYDRAAFREAVAAFDQALQALTHLPEHGDTRVLAIDLRLAADGPLTALGEYGRRLALLGEAEALAKALDDRTRWGRVLAQMAQVLRITGDADGAITAGQQAFALATELGDRALQIHASHNLGQVYEVTGDFGRAADLLRHNVEAVDGESSAASADFRLRSRAWLARTLSALGAFAEGRLHGEEALRLATLEGRGVTPIMVHGCLGELYLAQGDLAHAIQVFDQGLTLCRASGNRDWLRSIVADLGYTYALQGRLAEGRALLEEAIREGLSTGARHAAYRIAWLSEICRRAGHSEEAWQHACQALDLARQQKMRWEEALALRQLGAVYAHTTPPDVAQAEAHYRQALALAEEMGMRPLQAHYHLGLGTLYAAIGQREQTRTVLSTAIALYRDMDMTFWLPQAEAALAQTG
jgi:class 3 adenylate cyclase/tetratricopeptide (TPR) repeat protein